MDWVDFLLLAGIFLTFIIFAGAMLFIKRDVAKKRREEEDESD